MFQFKMPEGLPRALVVVASCLCASACATTATDDGGDEAAADKGATGAPGVGSQYLGIPDPSFGLHEVAGPPTAFADGPEGLSAIGPGAVLEVRGNHAGEEAVHCNGTREAPAFIVGGAGHRITAGWNVTGSYCILDGLVFAGAESGIGISGDHIALRNSDVSGFYSGGGASAGVFTGDASDIVIYRNKVHDRGDIRASFDQDASGITAATGSQRIWVLENETYRNSGDGINVNPYPYIESNRRSIRFVYIAGNKSWGNKQTGVWAKMSSDIIVSGNEVYSHRGSNSSLGQCTGFQYGTERMWFINNHIHDCDFGILIASDLGGNDGKDAYIVGNLIHDIHDHDGSLTGSAYSDAAVTMAGATNRYVINNTIDDADGGIQAPYGGTFRIANNILSRIKASRSDIFIEGSAQVVARNNLFDTAPRLDGSGCDACKVGGPGFLDVGEADFTLNAGSPAVDAGVQDDVYAEFQRLYGLSIGRDRAGVLRPQGGGWDIGAYERRP